MGSALEQEREARPAYVRFETVAVEDKAATLKAGHYVAKDVDYALITPPYSKDVMKHKVSTWLPQLEIDMRNNRIPQKWVEDYKKQYELFKKGQEIPLNGVAIRGWPIISPAQQETLIKMNILTVEDLSEINDEGLKRIGMGAIELKNKAKGYLSERDDKGSLAIEIADIKQKLANAEGVIDSLTAKNKELQRTVSAYEASGPKDEQEADKIEINDVLEDESPAKKRGKDK